MGEKRVKGHTSTVRRRTSSNVSLYSSNQSQHYYVVFFKITRVLNVLTRDYKEEVNGIFSTLILSSHNINKRQNVTLQFINMDNCVSIKNTTLKSS